MFVINILRMRYFKNWSRIRNCAKIFSGQTQWHSTGHAGWV